jgi:hypothetical protein
MREWIRRTLFRMLSPTLWAAIRDFYRQYEGEKERIKRREQWALAHYQIQLKNIKAWSIKHTEETNLYYDITPLNKSYLAESISLVTGHGTDKINELFHEIESDSEIRSHFSEKLSNLRWGKDIYIHYGRRLGWYAFVRIIKPKIIIETGVDLGVGSCLLSAALLRNAAEGAPGRYYGTDIRSEAGYLFGGKYATTGELIIGDSIQSLKKFDLAIDLFINDSDHTSNYEYNEYLTIQEKLSKTAIILGDNSESCDSLLKFSKKTGRSFLFFQEQPLNHWYPGGGIGISFHPHRSSRR